MFSAAAFFTIATSDDVPPRRRYAKVASAGADEGSRPNSGSTNRNSISPAPPNSEALMPLRLAAMLLLPRPTGHPLTRTRLARDPHPGDIRQTGQTAPTRQEPCQLNCRGSSIVCAGPGLAENYCHRLNRTDNGARTSHNAFRHIGSNIPQLAAEAAAAEGVAP